MTRSQVRSAAVAFVVVTGACLVILHVGSALLVGLTAAALAVVARRAVTVPEPEMPGAARPSRDGARGDLQDLTWSLVGRDGSAGARAVRRMRAMGAVRLARHGVDLAEPRDGDRAVALVGRRAYSALTRPEVTSLSIADVRHTIDALDHLGSNPRTHPEHT